MIERALWNPLVVCLNVGGQGSLKLLGGFESRLADDFCDSSVESFNHAVGLQVTGRGQSMFDLQAGAASVEGVLARTIAFITLHEEGDHGKHEDAAHEATPERASLAGVDESLRRRVDDDRRFLFA